MKKFIFVAGCARSGTGALAQLLSASDDIVMGMERFGHLESKGSFSLTPNHFEKERFFDVRDGDTFYGNFDEFHRHDKRIREKFDSCIYIGDKRPDLYECYDEIFQTFRDAVVFFIYRNIREVASSYQGRVTEGNNWPADKNFRAAVMEWNRSLFLTREAIRKGYDIRCVDYESVFLSHDRLDVVFSTLGLVLDACEWDRVNAVIARSEQLSKERVSLLSADEEDFVAENAKEFLVRDSETSNILRL